MIRKTILIISLLALTVLGFLAWLVHQASPGPANQDILGVTLGRSDSETGLAFLSGRRLDCTPEAEPPYTSTCTVTIAGKPLTIQAYRNTPTHPNQFGGGCEATYDGQTWPCEISSRHVHVHWFAYFSDPLGLDAAQMDALRRQYIFENLPEEPFLVATVAAPFVVTLLALLGLFAWRRSLNKRKWAMAVGLGLFTFFTTFFIAFRLTAGFWD